jgi:HEAT repeat protein
LETLGGHALKAIVAELNREALPWYYARNLCRVLGTLGDSSVTDMLLPYTKHAHYKVRREALNTVATVGGAAAEAPLLAGLHDSEASVQRAVLGQLSQRACSHPDFLAFINQVLRLQTDPSQEAPTAVQVAAIRAAEQLSITHAPNRERILALLADVVRPPPKVSLLTRLKGSQPHKEETVRLTACRTLAGIGTGTVVDALQAALNDRSAALKEQAAKALAQIQARAAP